MKPFSFHKFSKWAIRDISNPNYSSWYIVCHLSIRCSSQSLRKFNFWCLVSIFVCSIIAMKKRSQPSQVTTSNNNLNDQVKTNGIHPKPKEDSAEIQIVWKNVFLLGSIHLVALYGLYIIIVEGMRWTTFVSGKCKLFSVLSFFFAYWWPFRFVHFLQVIKLSTN